MESKGERGILKPAFPLSPSFVSWKAWKTLASLPPFPQHEIHPLFLFARLLIFLHRGVEKGMETRVYIFLSLVVDWLILYTSPIRASRRVNIYYCRKIAKPVRVDQAACCVFANRLKRCYPPCAIRSTARDSAVSHRSLSSASMIFPTYSMHRS